MPETQIKMTTPLKYYYEQLKVRLNTAIEAIDILERGIASITPEETQQRKMYWQGKKDGLDAAILYLKEYSESMKDSLRLE